jgi:hypothetical protein
LGISADEILRVNSRRQEPHERIVYPLLDAEPSIRRSDCYRIISEAGLPTPPKSACWFCPFHRPSTWAEMRRDRPSLFRRAVDLENLLNERRVLALGKDPVWLTRFNRPLSELPAAQDMLPILDESAAGHGDEIAHGHCDEGVCFV